jgi:hypothetical protein
LDTKKSCTCRRHFYLHIKRKCTCRRHISICTQREKSHVKDISIYTQRENANIEDIKHEKSLSPLYLCKCTNFFRVKCTSSSTSKRRKKKTTTINIIIHVVGVGCVGGGCQMTCMLQHRGECEL